jgi:hypothetical protein
MKKNIWLLWILAVVITLGSSYYQRLTGPTKPYRGKVELDGTEISYRLIRSFPRPTDAPVRVHVEDRDVKGYYRFKRYPSHDDWQEMQLERQDGMLVAYIPQQPAAGKVMYQIYLQKGDQLEKLSEDPIIIRFRNDVPAWALIPHIILMFLAMLWSMRTGLAALFRQKTFKLSLITIILLIAGGLIFGPIVQKFAFGDYWTGWPLGTDLTDNKTAIAFIFWLIAVLRSWKNPYHRSWVLVASVVLFLVYMIPHSLLGSEIDWTQEP